jgi:hypothetical protein
MCELPLILKNIKNNYEEKKIRINELSSEQEQFIHDFFNKHYYFYNATTEKFFHYDKLHYIVVSEDDVLYHILSSITQQQSCLTSWKLKTKTHIIKKIKDKSLIKYIPESGTIQFVLGLLCPMFFSSKTEAKYFLTVLGDSILKKNETPNYHFMEVKSKHFLRELNSLCYYYIGVNMLQTIKHKYHDTHQYAQCRFIKINNNVQNDLLWKSVFDYAIDLFVVASYYSTRYSSSDNYLLNYSNNVDLVANVMFLKDKTPEELVELFLKEYIQTIPSSMSSSPCVGGMFESAMESVKPRSVITWKNILYLWRSFLETKGLPNIMFHESLKGILVSHYGENYNNDQFVGLTSKYLPLVHHFMDFWEKHIVEDKESELEIEEIRVLFKKHQGKFIRDNVDDIKIINIISFFFPHIEIISEKYIYGISCNLWDKDLEIQIALQSLKDKNKEDVDLDEKYLYYCRYFAEDSLLVSKSYFEKSLIVA